MVIFLWLIGLSLTAAASETAPASAPPSVEVQNSLDFLVALDIEADDIEVAAENERVRALAFDEQFGDGAYKGVVDFKKRCRFKDGCDIIKIAPILRGADDFVALEQEVKDAKLVDKSPPYENRREGIKTGMRGAMEEFRPREGARPSYVADFIKASEPIVNKIFTTEELLQYKERTATTTDAAPAYANLGQALNGAGRLGQALAAFDTALEKEPKNQQALEGRALSRMVLGDYPGAVGAARDALKSYPNDKNAYAILKFSEGRTRAGALRGSPGGASSPPSAEDLAALSAAAPGLGIGAANPGGPGRFSSEVTVGAAAGAIRAAGEQAQNGARSALKLGDASSALAILNKALSSEPGNPALLNLRAQALGRLGRWEEALKDAKAGLALLPGNFALLNTKALAENRTRRYRDALATAEQMIAADPRNAWGYANRAHAYGGLGDKASLLSDLSRAAGIDPRFRRIADAAPSFQIPSDSDILFLFPGEVVKGSPGAPKAGDTGRSKSFGLLVGAGLAGGLLLALGLLSAVLAPIKNSVVAMFTRRSTVPAHPPAGSARPASDPAGGLIRGQYEISHRIGAGGMGVVYDGMDRSLGRRVAIKKMRDELRLNARERDRLIVEAKTVASLRHPNIVDIYAIAEEGDDVYLVFEYVDGKTVHDLVQTKGRLDAAAVVSMTRAMGEALTYAHSRGIIHRDMKPSNVMLSNAGEIKVMDFGIARMAKDALTRYSMTNTVVGTPPYMAPEQEQGVVRKESDVYSLAICAYEMLTGKLPFIGIGAGMLMNKINMSYIPPSRNIAGLPEALDEVFLKAFQADPDRRHRTPREFVSALEAAADGARSKSA